MTTPAVRTDLLLTDDDLSAGRDRTRAILAQRYEMVWQACEPHVNGDRERAGERVDPRMVEIALRALDRLGRVHQVERPPVGQDGAAVAGVTDREVVEAELLALEARAR